MGKLSKKIFSLIGISAIFLDHAMQMRRLIFGSPSFSIPLGASLSVSPKSSFNKLTNNPHVLVRF